MDKSSLEFRKSCQTFFSGGPQICVDNSLQTTRPTPILTLYLGPDI
jgi:hypothetical protein